MRNVMRDVTRFHEFGGQAIGEHMESFCGDYPIESTLALALQKMLEGYASKFSRSKSKTALRLRLICEEFAETIEAFIDEDPVATADGMVDLVYVIAGAGVTFGLPLEHVFEEVQRANIDKFPNGVAIKDDNGKVIKPEGWQAPDVMTAMEHGGYMFKNGWYRLHRPFTSADGLPHDRGIICISGGQIVAHVERRSDHNTAYLFRTKDSGELEVTHCMNLRPGDEPCYYDSTRYGLVSTNHPREFPRAIALCEEILFGFKGSA
jgi:hypothetical protein